MTAGLSENIDKRFEMDPDIFVSKLNHFVTDRFQFFPDKPLYGKIADNKLYFKINPSLMASDLFKSIACGHIYRKDTITHLHLRVTASWTIIIFFLLFFSLLIYSFIISNFSYLTLEKVVHFSIISVIFFSIAKIKVNWDKRRLDKLLTKIISNYERQKNGA